MVKSVVELTDNQKKYFSSMRGCNYDIVCYLPLNDIEDYIINGLNAYKYAISPLHDKDKKDNGELKKPHYHLVLCFGTKKRGTQLVRLFNTTEIRLINNTSQLKGSFEYLTHDSKNCEGKVKYEKSKLRSNDLVYFNNLDDSVGVDNSYDIIDRLNRQTSIREMVKLYGKDFIYHFDNYVKVAKLIAEEDTLLLYKKRLKTEPFIDNETGEIEQIEF